MSCLNVANAWTEDYTRLSKRAVEQAARDRERGRMIGSLQRHLMTTVDAVKSDGFSRMEKCRFALRVLDENGWARSVHQKSFHEV